MKYILVDNKIRDIEKEKLSELGYEVILLDSNNLMYDEISSHSDIFTFKIENNLICEEVLFDKLKSLKLDCKNNIEKIDEHFSNKYPEDIYLNICLIGKKAFHNFKYTSKKAIDLMDKYAYEKINVKQGYTNCSIAVIDDNSAIVSDVSLEKVLKENGIDVLRVDTKGKIKLLKNDKTISDMEGFIGGSIVRVENNIIVFGDIEKIDEDGKIKKFISSKGLNLITFPGLDVIDYGGVIAF